MNVPKGYKPWSAEITLGTGDTTKTLLAAPATGKKIVVTTLVVHGLVAAAQAITIAIGSVSVLKLPASFAAGGEAYIGPLEYGVIGDSATALIITPAAAGPSIHAVAEGYYLPS